MANKPIYILIFALCLIQSCSSQDNNTDKGTVYLNQTDYNIKKANEYEAVLKKVDSLYHNMVEKYNTCSECYDHVEWINQNHTTLLSLIESHQSWKLSLKKQDSVILNAYDGGSMASGVLNQNRIIQIKARIQFYELLN